MGVVQPYERLLVIHPITGFSGRTFERTGYIAEGYRSMEACHRSRLVVEGDYQYR